MADFAAGQTVSVDENLPEWLRNAILGITNPINQPFAHELWVTEPAALLAKVSVPVLILIGKKDLQVDWQADGAVFEAAAQDRRNITIAYAENANHVLKYEPRERSSLTAAEAASGYNADASVLDEESRGMISSWLDAHSRA